MLVDCYQKQWTILTVICHIHCAHLITYLTFQSYSRTLHKSSVVCSTSDEVLQMASTFKKHKLSIMHCLALLQVSVITAYRQKSAINDCQ